MSTYSPFLKKEKLLYNVIETDTMKIICNVKTN